MGAVQNFDWKACAASTADWWQEAGVDVAISETPRNWLAPASVRTATAVLAEAPRSPVSAKQRQPSPAGILAPAPCQMAMPETIDAFLAWRLGPDAPDAAWSGIALPAEGPTDAALMIVIEMPEREDADAGLLLSGATGRLFVRMLAAIGRTRESVAIVPMCVKRPNSGRLPLEAEPLLSAALHQHITLAAPKHLLLFGNAASRALLGADVTERRGALRPINQAGGQRAVPLQAIASFHPRFLLERPAAKAEAWKDLQLLIQGIDA